MDESTTGRELRKRSLKPYRLGVPMWASMAIAVLVLAIAAATLAPKKVR